MAISLLAIGVTTAEAFKDIECKAKTDMMITKPGTYERVVTLVDQRKVAAAQKSVVCMIKKGRGVFIVGKPKPGRLVSKPPAPIGDPINTRTGSVLASLDRTS